MEEYTSEFTAPLHSILERRAEGLNIVTTVVMDGEVMTFVKAIDRSGSAEAS